MSRTVKLKLLYMGLIGCASGVLVAAFFCVDAPLPVWLIVLVTLLIPSRVQGWYWRDFFRGRRLLSAGNARDAAIHFERFLGQLRNRHELRRLIWLNGTVYTLDAEAMTLNNLGAARLQLGDLRGAHSAFEDASSRDPAYPLPFYNLALLAQIEEREADATELLARACRLGYAQAKADRLIVAAGALLARMEGRGSSAPPSGHCIHCGYDLTGNTSRRCPECGALLTT